VAVHALDRAALHAHRQRGGRSPRPFRSTEAAAQLLAYNYRVLGSWPLALTAYNHGTAGVRHAKETLGTDDIVRIVRSYNSRTFGFASRISTSRSSRRSTIDRNPEKYFGALQKQSETRFQEVQVPAYVPWRRWSAP